MGSHADPHLIKQLVAPSLFQSRVGSTSVRPGEAVPLLPNGCVPALLLPHTPADVPGCLLMCIPSAGYRAKVLMMVETFRLCTGSFVLCVDLTMNFK